MKEYVLMAGPARSVHGGVSAVVNNYYKAGIEQKVKIKYIATMVDGSKLRKLLQAFTAYIRAFFLLPGCSFLHVHMASDSSIYRKSIIIHMAKLLKKPVLIHQHGGDFIHYFNKECSEKKKKYIVNILNMADIMIVLSEQWKNFFMQIVSEDKIRVLENSIIIPEIKDKEYSNHNLIFLGRLSNDKGIRELLTVVEKISEEVPDVCLYLAGLWEDFKLEEKAAELKEHVKFVGWVDEESRNTLLTSCSIFVLPSYFEGQPISLLEAMGAGCAVIATCVGGIPQIVEEGEGILVTPKSETELLEAVKSLITDTAKKEEIGKRAQAKIKTQYDIKENVNRLIAIYSEVEERGEA